MANLTATPRALSAEWPSLPWEATLQRLGGAVHKISLPCALNERLAFPSQSYDAHNANQLRALSYRKFLEHHEKNGTGNEWSLSQRTKLWGTSKRIKTHPNLTNYRQQTSWGQYERKSWFLLVRSPLLVQNNKNKKVQQQQAWPRIRC